MLEDGQKFEGYSFGKERSMAGEVVFNTGLTGYVILKTPCQSVLVARDSRNAFFYVAIFPNMGKKSK